MPSSINYGWILLEERQGKPIRAIITDTYAETGSMVAAASLLGVPATTLYGWCRQLGIKIARNAVVAAEIPS